MNKEIKIHESNMPTVITGIMLHPNDDIYSRSELEELIGLGELYIINCSEDMRYDFWDFISTNDQTRHHAESIIQITDINELYDFYATNRTTIAWSDDSKNGFWTATLQTRGNKK